MPTEKDLEKIAKMVEEIGDVEKSLGVIDESYLEKAELKEEKETDELNELLEDIKIGLEEEKELESKTSIEQEAPSEERIEKIKKEKAVEIEEPIEKLEPQGRKMPKVLEGEGEEEKIEEVEKVEKGAGVTKEEKEEAEKGVELEISEEELQKEISHLEGEEGGEEGEELLDLPDDFDIDRMTFKEEPPAGFFKSEEKLKKEEKKESEKEEEKEAGGETPEEALTKELEGIIEGVEEEEQFPETLGPLGEEERIKLPEEPPSEGEKIEREPIEKKVEEEAKKESAILGEELPEIEEIISGESPIEEPVEEASEIETQGPEIPIEEKTESGIENEESLDLELSDEDIILITTKLKQLSPELAIAIRDSILQSEIPPEKLKGLLELLIEDSPEEEIKNYYESVTGKKVIVEKVPTLIRVEKKPGPFAAVYENLAPMVRVSALGIIVVAILLSIFMLFFYRPIKAEKYYKIGIEYLRSENYTQAEKYFRKGQSIYTRVVEYDKYGWEYMLAGNYDKAMEKFLEGIKKDRKYKVLSLRLHLAKLYNILGRYKEADKIYSNLVRRYPKVYEYIKLKGLNLLDWGKIDKKQLKKAYGLFAEANKNFPRESDPIIKMLYINILFDKISNVKNLYNYLNQNFPNKLDSFVHTELASYFVKKGEFTLAKNLLMELLAKYPEYPPLYYAYAEYYKAIGSKKDQGVMLNLAISKEESREIIYPWDSRDRNLLSKAYNDLGELYANLEVPGKSAEAIRYFKKAIEENPENKIAYFNIAQVYFYKEMDYGLAEKYYIEAKRRGFVNKDLIYNLGVLFFYKRDFSKAVNDWISLNEMMPGNPNVSFALACALLHLKKYEAALGELINLSETYNKLIKELGEIKPWRAYHRMILLNASAVYNNLGVAYEKLYEKTKNLDYQKKSLISLYKAGEFADIIGIDRGNIQYNINYILHPNVIRANMAISDNISTNYRFIHQ